MQRIGNFCFAFQHKQCGWRRQEETFGRSSWSVNVYCTSAGNCEDNTGCLQNAESGRDPLTWLYFQLSVIFLALCLISSSSKYEICYNVDKYPAQVTAIHFVTQWKMLCYYVTGRHHVIILTRPSPHYCTCTARDDSYSRGLGTGLHV